MKSVLQYLERSAAAAPEKTAVIDIGGRCTYGQLLQHSRAIGTALLGHLTPRCPCLCFMDKSIATLEAFFGAVYAGGFYSLLDPSFPAERVQQILSVLEPEVILTTHGYDSLLPKLGDYRSRVLYLETLPHRIDEEALSRRRSAALDTDPLYCNFTSGSTGTPKGVLVGHRSVIDFIDCFTRTFSITAEDVIGNQAPFDFDVSVKDIYSCMAVGATLVLLPREYFMFPVKLMDLLEEHGVTTLIWAVSALCMLIRLHGFRYKVPPAIHKILFSGEVMPIRPLNKLRALYPDALFVNLYGPTEITCNCTYHILDRDYEETEALPIGIPFDNEQVFLLDDHDQLPAPGQPGEICVAGTALALGYYRDPRATARSFPDNPLEPRFPQRIYRTGDLGYCRDGLLYFSGRKDFQIKHMGHRIELEEIELHLSALSGVSHACCAYDQRRSRIVAFYVGATGRDDLAAALKQKLPEYMVPNVFVCLDSLPLTKNGKTDRRGLLRQYQEGGFRG